MAFLSVVVAIHLCAGLSLVKNFVELRGSYVILDLTLHKGTTVIWVFPTKHQAPQEVAF